MLRILEGGCVLVLLAVFLAYLLAPEIEGLQRRIRPGRRRRPLARGPSILLAYGVLFAAGAVTWRAAAPRIDQWVRVTAPAVLERMFAGGEGANAVRRAYATVPQRVRPMATQATLKGLAGSYNETGIRRWFQRKRTMLDGRTPAALLKREWDPDDEGPRRVRQLARNLVTLSAT